MAGVSFNPNVGQGQTKDPVVGVRVANPAAKEVKAVTLSADQVQIKKGVLPTFKGAGAGALAGGLGAGVAAAVLMAPAFFSGGEGPAWAALGVVMGAAIGTIPGAVIGGTTANVTNNKIKATAVGALTGAAAGAVLGGIKGNIVFSTVIGAGAGAASGFTGALVAKTK